MYDSQFTCYLPGKKEEITINKRACTIFVPLFNDNKLHEVSISTFTGHQANDATKQKKVSLFSDETGIH